MASPKVKKRIKKNVVSGVAHISTTFNNSMITITDTTGNALAWSSCGAKGFKGSKKSTPFAAQVAAEEACRKARDFGLRAVEVHITGPGSGRETALRAISSSGIKITLIKDVTPVPHNGCRPPKRRRV